MNFRKKKLFYLLIKHEVHEETYELEGFLKVQKVEDLASDPCISVNLLLFRVKPSPLRLKFLDLRYRVTLEANMLCQHFMKNQMKQKI